MSNSISDGEVVMIANHIGKEGDITDTPVPVQDATFPSWRDRPTCSGWWIWRTTNSRGSLYKINDVKMWDDACGLWYGPIPEPPQ